MPDAKKMDPQLLEVLRIHEFQQVTLPQWVFDPDSIEIVDLYCGFLDQFMTSIRKECGTKFADSLAITTRSNPSGHLLEFDPPEEASLCRFLFIAVAPQARIYMAERSLSGGLMLCEKNEDGQHRNHGPLKAKTAKVFLQRVRELLIVENS